MPGYHIGYVYFLHAPSPVDVVKIGYSDNPVRRLADIQLACPVILEPLGFVRGTQFRESDLHRQFVHLRLHGEWFRAGEDLMEYIRTKARPWRTKFRKLKLHSEETCQRKRRAEREEFIEWACVEATPEIMAAAMERKARYARMAAGLE